MILGGAVAGQGETSVILTIGIVWVCAAAGDSVSFLLGRRLGRDFVMRHGPRVRITHERFARVEDYFSRHGGKTILVGRFIGLVRALAPFVAGGSGMRYTGFLRKRPRHGAVGGRVRAARVLGLAETSTPPPTRPGRARCTSARGRLDRGPSCWRSGSCAIRRTGSRLVAGMEEAPVSSSPWWRWGVGCSPRRGSCSRGSPLVGSGSSYDCGGGAGGLGLHRGRDASTISARPGPTPGIRPSSTSWTSSRWRGSSPWRRW